ncbi:MAG: exo-alpha-sialidase, partial [Gammaproteobacteria bacterium]|nr:exo-alpha-sialidase [Gammaproteobacteria bacterium]
HKILTDPGNPDRIWAGISAAGVFRSDDGGDTWLPVNTGVAKTVPSRDFDDIGSCVHGLALDPDDSNLIYRQDHQGVYRSSNGGDTWERTETGLPGTFGFPMVMDRSSKTIFVVPLQSDEYRLPPNGRFRVYRSIDGAETWQVSGTGHPKAPTFTPVLRGAMDTDHEGGVYLGTTSGQFRFTVDGGDSWMTEAWTLPRILCVKVLPV